MGSQPTSDLKRKEDSGGGGSPSEAATTGDIVIYPGLNNISSLCLIQDSRIPPEIYKYISRERQVKREFNR